jgi:hypothetical protein
MVRGRGGQTVVELMLILPIFFLLFFFLLELGNIAYQTVVAHHAAYELARVAGMVGVTQQGGATNEMRIRQKLKQMSESMFKERGDRLEYELNLETTSKDPQSKGHSNEDVIVTVIYPVKMIFPMTNIIFADPPKKLGIRRIRATVRMPVERPLLN